VEQRTGRKQASKQANKQTNKQTKQKQTNKLATVQNVQQETVCVRLQLRYNN
jgi:hypothetical protein